MKQGYSSWLDDSHNAVWLKHISEQKMVVLPIPMLNLFLFQSCFNRFLQPITWFACFKMSNIYPQDHRKMNGFIMVLQLASLWNFLWTVILPAGLSFISGLVRVYLILHKPEYLFERLWIAQHQQWSFSPFCPWACHLMYFSLLHSLKSYLFYTVTMRKGHCPHSHTNQLRTKA